MDSDPASAGAGTGTRKGLRSAAGAAAPPIPGSQDRLPDLGGAGEEAAEEEKAAARLPTIEMRSRSVIDFVGTVNEAIIGKAIPQPELMDFNGWKLWRSKEGKRPTVSRGTRGTEVFTTAKEETI